MPIIKSNTDLGNDYDSISNLCYTCGEPVFITKNGKGDLAVMSIEAYEELIETASIDAAIGKAESEYMKTHESHDARAALASLRRKHFG